MPAPVLHDAVGDLGDVGDAAAPHANRHAGAGLEPRREAAVLELAPGFCTDIGQAEVREILADEEQAGRHHQVSSREPTLSFISLANLSSSSQDPGGTSARRSGPLDPLKRNGLQIERRFSRFPDRTDAHGGPAVRQAHGAGGQCGPFHFVDFRARHAVG